MEANEVWKAVVGFEELYEVSDQGKVRVKLTRRGSRQVGYELRTGSDNHGYPCIWLWKDAVKKRFKVHHLVANAFIGIRPEGYELNHKDGVRHNNSLENLEWVTRSDNAYHAYRVLGRKGASPKVTPAQVKAIRERYAQGNISMRELGRQYGIAAPTVHNLVHGITWKRV